MECWTLKNFQLAVASFQVFVKICFSATYMCEWHVWRHCTKRLGWSRASLRTCWSKQAAAWLSITWSSSLARKWTSYLSAVRRTGTASSTSRWRFVRLVMTQPTPLWLPTCLIDLPSVEGVTYWCIGVSTAISVQISDILKTATTNPNQNTNSNPELDRSHFHHFCINNVPFATGNKRTANDASCWWISVVCCVLISDSGRLCDALVCHTVNVGVLNWWVTGLLMQIVWLVTLCCTLLQCCVLFWSKWTYSMCNFTVSCTVMISRCIS